MKTKLLLLISTIIIISCSESNSPTEESNNFSAKEVWPLAVGNYWQFQKINHAWPSPPNTYVTSIKKDTIINGKRLFVFDDFSNSVDSSIYSYINREDGFYNIYYNTSNNTFKERHLFKYPCKTGDIYNKFDDYNYSVVANTNLNISFNNQSQKAILYVIHSIDTINVEKHYDILDSAIVIPGIGLIEAKGYRQVDNTDSMALAIEMQLIDYKIIE